MRRRSKLGWYRWRQDGLWTWQCKAAVGLSSLRQLGQQKHGWVVDEVTKNLRRLQGQENDLRRKESKWSKRASRNQYQKIMPWYLIIIPSFIRTIINLKHTHFVFHSPAFSAPFPTLWAPSSKPPVTDCRPSPAAFVPVVLLTVSPTPRPAVPTTPPTVFDRPPARLPTCG